MWAREKEKKKKFSLPQPTRKIWDVFRHDTEKRGSLEDSGRAGSFYGPAGVSGMWRRLFSIILFWSCASASGRAKLVAGEKTIDTVRCIDNKPKVLSISIRAAMEMHLTSRYYCSL